MIVMRKRCVFCVFVIGCLSTGCEVDGKTGAEEEKSINTELGNNCYFFIM